MMKHFVFALTLAAVALAGTSSTGAEGTPLAKPADVKAALEAFLKDLYPAAEISMTNDVFSAKASTMKFTLHPISRDGVISDKTYQSEGPKHDGFILEVSYKKGRYRGPLKTPTTLREPYWSTFVNEIYNKEADTHLWVAYSYGSRVNQKLHTQIPSLLGKPSFPESKPEQKRPDK